MTVWILMSNDIEMTTLKVFQSKEQATQFLSLKHQKECVKEERYNDVSFAYRIENHWRYHLYCKIVEGSDDKGYPKSANAPSTI